jgi:hypothetical protein
MSRYLKNKSNLELIDEAYETQLDPLWSPQSTRDWYDRYEGNIGTARGVGPGEAPVPEMDLLDWSAMAPLVGDATGPMADIRMYLEQPDQRTLSNYLFSSAGLLPFVPSVAGTLRGIKGRAAKQPYYHGTAASTSSEVTDPGTILESGYLRGQSQEMGTPGTSLSADPTTSLRGFTPDHADTYSGRMKYGDPRRADAMLVNRLTDPENVWNLTPDMYRAKMGPKDPEATFRKTNYFNEAETFAKRRPDQGGIDTIAEAEKESTMAALSTAMGIIDDYFATGHAPNTSSVAQLIEGLPPILDDFDHELGMSPKDYMEETLSGIKSGKIDEEEGWYDLMFTMEPVFFKTEAGEYVDTYVPPADATSASAPGVTPVRGGVEVPSIGGFAPSPAPLTEQEVGQISRAGAAYDNATRVIGRTRPKSVVDIYDKSTGKKFWEVPPQRVAKDIMNALDGMRGYQGSYRGMARNLAEGIARPEAGPPTAILYAMESLPLASKDRISKAAHTLNRLNDEVQFRASRLLMNPDIWGDYKSLEEIDEAVKAGKVTLNDIGDPEFRQMYRDEAKARQHFHDVLRNEIFKTKKEPHSLELATEF